MKTSGWTTLLAGTYTRPGRGAGIHRLQFDPASGQLAAAGVAAEVLNPSWLLADAAAGRLFAVSEVPGAGEVCWLEPAGDGLQIAGGSLQSAGGSLRVAHRITSGGGLPCYLCRDGGDLLVANYEDGAVTRLPLTAAGFGAPQTVHHVHHNQVGADGERQAGPHAHGVFVTDSGLLATDLGCDAVFRHTSGEQPEVYAGLPPGCGPRLLAAAGGYLFVIGELDNQLHVIRHAQLVASVPLLPARAAGDSAAGHVALHPDGRHLLVSNRGNDSLVVFDVSSPGAPRCLGHVPSGGRHPRHFMITADGRWVIVANRDSDNLVVFAFTDRGLEARSRLEGVGSPVCVVGWPAVS